jgi:ubiquinone/menaquinone biosynthesis C-methylase UbiE
MPQKTNEAPTAQVKREPRTPSLLTPAAATSTLERYERIAAFYDLLDFPFEYRRYRKIRPLLFAGLSGLILDAGVGTGRNFSFYPHGAKIVGIDLSPAMLARAERRRPSAPAEVELRQMDVTCLGFPDRFFDAAVATFLFCVLPDELQVPALKETGRVVKAGASFASWNILDRAGRFGGQ